MTASDRSAFGDVGEACLDVVGERTRLTQEMLGLRRLVKGHIYKSERKGKELE